VDILPALIESLSKCGFLTDHLAMPHTHAEAEAEGAVDKGKHRDGVDSNKKRGQGRRWEKKSKGSHPVQTHQDESNTEPDPESISSGRWPYFSLPLRLQLLSPLILPSSIYLLISMLDISSLICLSFFLFRSSYMGICRVPTQGALYRRIDMKSYRKSQVRQRSQKDEEMRRECRIVV
jgi:hypothetical protein